MITVEIDDRQFDFTDEQVAAEAVAEFQIRFGLDDNELLSIWADQKDVRRAELEDQIIAAVDLNGSAKRAAQTVPTGIHLKLEDEEH